MPAMPQHSRPLPPLTQATAARADMGAEGIIEARRVALPIKYLLMVHSQTGAYYNFLHPHPAHHLLYRPQRLLLLLLHLNRATTRIFRTKSCSLSWSLPWPLLCYGVGGFSR